jgi:hypothetical protein
MTRGARAAGGSPQGYGWCSTPAGVAALLCLLVEEAPEPERASCPVVWKSTTTSFQGAGKASNVAKKSSYL